MSAERTKFEVAAAKSNWQDAFNNLNTLSMEEMLDSLSALPKATLDNLIQRRFAFKVGLDMPRMEYAWTVVKNKKLPLIAPNDLLATKQVETAAKFLKTTAPKTPSKTLSMIVFTDSIVTNRLLFPRYRTTAEKILATQGNGFKLDVQTYATDIPLQEVVYLSTQLEDMVTKAKAQTTIPSNKAIVLLVKVKTNINVHGLAIKINNQRIVVIDTESPNPDGATLLHELGHCAGLPHAGETPVGKTGPVDVGGTTNVMAEAKAGITRDQLTVTQGEAFSSAYFAS